MNVTTAHNRADIMAAMPCTQREIQERTGLGTGTVSRHITAMMSCGLISIAGHAHADGVRSSSRVYAVGSTVCPPPPTKRKARQSRRQSRPTVSCAPAKKPKAEKLKAEKIKADNPAKWQRVHTVNEPAVRLFGYLQQWIPDDCA